MKKFILVVDPIGKVRLELSIYLSKYNIELLHTRDMVGAVSKTLEHGDNIKLVIWYIDITEDEEFEEVNNFKNSKEFSKDIPLIIISNSKSKKYVIKAISIGAVDYITTPFTEELIIKKLNQTIGEYLDSKKKFLEETYDDEDKISYSIQEILTIHLKGVTRGGYPLSMIMLRLINTHETKEARKKQIVNDIVKIIKTKLRETDITIKYGIGDVVIILPFTDKIGASFVERKIIVSCNESTILNKKGDGYILATSVVNVPEDGKIIEPLLTKLIKRLKPVMFFTKDQKN